MKQVSPWRLEGSLGCLEAGQLKLSIDLERPDRGGRLTLSGCQVEGSLWGWAPVEAPTPRLLDAYLRGADLIAEYGPCEDFPFHSQAYWRWEPQAESLTGSLSLILSVRTHKLATHPVFTVGSSLPTAETELLDSAEGEPPGALYRDQENGWSAVETIQPGDLTSAGVQIKNSGSQWRLFDHFLEKGVIRRARLSIAFTSSIWSRPQAVSVAEGMRAVVAPLAT